MRLERLQLRGFSSAFPGAIDLDLRGIPQGSVVACLGGNGAGKTTLFESVPGAIFRQLPARNGEDPVTYATGRDSYLDLEYSVDGRGAFHIRLNLDGPKRQTDAVLEAIHADGTRVPLNDGKRSTFDEAIKARFPSFDLFINSSFAAQGRGDEFTRRKPSQRKDLFVEFLALQHYAAMSKTAAEAADLAHDGRLRLEVQVEQLARETAPALLEALDQQAQALQVQGGQAELRQLEMRSRLDTLEARAALLGDQVAAYTAAEQRVRMLEAERLARQADLRTIKAAEVGAAAGYTDERARVLAKRDVDLADLAKRIAGNQQIREQADSIHAAVEAIVRLDRELGVARQQLETCLAAQQRAAVDLRAVEQQLAALTATEKDLARAQGDANLLLDVPCGGEGEYAACQFLVNAKKAEAQIAALAKALRPKADLADRVGALTRDGDAQQVATTNARRRIQVLENMRAGFQKDAAYEAPLAAADARIAELTAQQAAVAVDAEERVQAANRRRAERIAELEAQGRQLTVTIGRLDADLWTAQADLEAATTGHSQANEVLLALRSARAEWDAVTTTLATIAGARQALEQRRLELTTKRTTLTELRGRLSRVEQEWLEWKDLAKALGKGGLPDLEIDAAGPTISALTTELLLACFGPRFSLELVTQVAKSDGSGLKDLFTVEVTDNEAGGATRDISQLSGGEKTIVQEALMSAISLYVNARSPQPIRTLWRDETGAALDAVNAVRYVAMLRKVQELGGYHHVFFISHNADAAALADVQIQVGEGKAVIGYPPFVEVAAA